MPATSCVFISTTPRTGSSLLSEALEFTGLAGIPREYFEPVTEKEWGLKFGISGNGDYIEKILAAGTTPNGVFGAKVHWHQFVHLRRKLRSLHGNGISDLDLVSRSFADVKYVFLTRRDKVAQAVSFYKAQRTDVWHVVRSPGAESTPGTPTQPVAFDLAQVDHWVARFAEDETSWCRFFESNELEPFEVVYEDFLDNYQSTVLAILRYLNIPIPAGLRIAPPRLNRLADGVSTKWVSRYKALRRPSRIGRPTAGIPYFISTSPRTGGFLLAEGLQSTGIAGRPREYFDPLFEKQSRRDHANKPEFDFLESVIAAGTTLNGVFGAKVLWHQFEHFLSTPRQIAGSMACGFELLRRLFPDLRYVFLTRKDKVRQAVSYYRAIRTGVWWSIRASANGNEQSLTQSAERPPFNFEQIDEWVTRLTQFETCWRHHFRRAGVRPFEIAYEDLVRAYESTVLEILGYLDIPMHAGLLVAPPRLQKQADELTEEWIDRYKRLKGL
jgi:LPS sulfotransferase NodH